MEVRRSANQHDPTAKQAVPGVLNYQAMSLIKDQNNRKQETEKIAISQATREEVSWWLRVDNGEIKKAIKDEIN